MVADQEGSPAFFRLMTSHTSRHQSPALCRLESGPMPFHARSNCLSISRSVAPNDIDGLLAVTSGNRDGFRRAARHIGPIGGRDRRRIAMGPIPGNVMGVGVVNVARCRWRTIRHGFAARGAIVGIREARPKRIVSAMMPERVGEQRTGNRMRRGKRCTSRRSRPGERFTCREQNRNYAERRDKRPILSICHRTHQLVGYWAAQNDARPGFLGPQTHT
jgi:hypothetical protein